MKFDLRFLSGVAVATTLGLTGCPADDSGETNADGGSTDGTATATETMSGPGSMSDPSMSGGSESMSGASMSSGDPTTETATVTGDPTTVTDSDSTESSGGNLPNGETCMNNDQCESGMCFLAGILGGICGECLTEEDCEFGCSLPNPLVDPPTGSSCNDGSLGQGCDTAAACVDADHVCALIIDVPGVLSASTCSECETTADCDAPQVCNVSIVVEDISGQKTCIDAGTVADGDFCDITAGSPDDACMNFCASANIMGLVEFGVCGPCSNVNMPNEGCGAGETCEDPTVELDGTVVPSQCV